MKDALHPRRKTVALVLAFTPVLAIASPSHADAAGDGDLDLVTADEQPASEFEGSSHTVLLNDGAGVFAVTQYVLPFGGYPAVPVIADLDGDGVVDLAASHYGPHDVLVRLGNGDGTFGEPYLYDSAAGAFGLAAGDMNGDGGIDLVVTGYDGDAVVVLKNRCPAPCDADVDGDGDVGFADLLAVLSTWGPCRRACPADLDGDRDVDFDDLLVVLSSWGPCSG